MGHLLLVPVPQKGPNIPWRLAGAGTFKWSLRLSTGLRIGGRVEAPSPKLLATGATRLVPCDRIVVWSFDGGSSA